MCRCRPARAATGRCQMCGRGRSTAYTVARHCSSHGSGDISACAPSSAMCWSDRSSHSGCSLHALDGGDERRLEQPFVLPAFELPSQCVAGEARVPAAGSPAEPGRRFWRRRRCSLRRGLRGAVIAASSEVSPPSRAKRNRSRVEFSPATAMSCATDGDPRRHLGQPPGVHDVAAAPVALRFGGHGGVRACHSQCVGEHGAAQSPACCDDRRPPAERPRRRRHLPSRMWQLSKPEELPAVLIDEGPILDEVGYGDERSRRA